MQLYTSGAKFSPGSVDDVEHQRSLSVDCWVFLMRRDGRRLPARKVGEPFQGSLLLLNRYDEEDRFVARLFQPAGQFTDFALELHGAGVLREAGTVRTISGDEFVWSIREHRRQTWLCTPTAERGYEILREMIKREQ